MPADVMDFVVFRMEYGRNRGWIGGGPCSVGRVVGATASTVE
ncbi:MAG TPA: hypothetical protein VK816_09355 [Jatrophihabitantaceae bacterium]|nr:hypothetical protein [Jatrophihabitantaceae bacterium]